MKKSTELLLPLQNISKLLKTNAYLQVPLVLKKQ